MRDRTGKKQCIICRKWKRPDEFVSSTLVCVKCSKKSIRKLKKYY